MNKKFRELEKRMGDLVGHGVKKITVPNDLFDYLINKYPDNIRNQFIINKQFPLVIKDTMVDILLYDVKK